MLVGGLPWQGGLPPAGKMCQGTDSAVWCTEGVHRGRKEHGQDAIEATRPQACIESAYTWGEVRAPPVCFWVNSWPISAHQHNTRAQYEAAAILQTPSMLLTQGYARTRNGKAQAIAHKGPSCRADTCNEGSCVMGATVRLRTT